MDITRFYQQIVQTAFLGRLETGRCNGPTELPIRIIPHLIIFISLFYGICAAVQVARAAGTVHEAVADCTPIDFDSTISGSIDTPAEQDCFTFSGVAGDRIRVSVVSTSGTLTAMREITNPNGTSLCGAITNPINCTLTATGTHTVLVYDFGGTGTGNYNIHIQRLNNPVGCTTIPFGESSLSGSITGAAEQDCYTFSGVAGDRIRVSVVKTSSTLTAMREITSPNGTSLCGAITNPIDCTLTATGTHTVLVYDFGGTGTGNYNIHIQRLNNPASCTAIPFGGTSLSGSIASAAEQDCFTFSGVAGDRIRVSVVKTSGTLTAMREITNPNGTSLCGAITNPINCTLTTTGTHTVLVYDFGGTGTGNYNIHIQRLNNAVSCTAIPFGGTSLSGSIASAAEQDCYTFSGVAGDRIRVSAVSTSGTLTAMREITNPNGTSLCGAITNPINCTLTTTGTHTVLVYDFTGTGTGNYSISIQRLSQFDSIGKWTSSFDLSHGWTVSEYVRTVGDVNADGEADLVGFGLDGVYVALSTGNGFGVVSKWTSAFDLSHGWTVSQYVRTVGDVNGDGRADLVGFGLDGVYVALALNPGPGFGPISKWCSCFDQSHGWNHQNHVRTVGDVNGDGKADLVGFGLDGVYVALSTGSGFGMASKWISAFDSAHGWTVADYVRTVGDVSGDGMADLVGFGLDGVYVALSNGSGFNAVSKWTSSFDLLHGWTVSGYVRTVGDVNGDGKVDVVGFGLDGVYVGLSTGTAFSSASKGTSAFDLLHGWTVSQYVRTVGDVSGDGKEDLVGFGLDGVYVSVAE